jgi:hypothetical protein
MFFLEMLMGNKREHPYCPLHNCHSHPIHHEQLQAPIKLFLISLLTNRIPYFTQVTWYTHIYAAEKGASLGFGHKWVPPDVAEMVRWTAIPIHHGSLDGQPGTLSCPSIQED